MYHEEDLEAIFFYLSYRYRFFTIPYHLGYLVPRLFKFYALSIPTRLTYRDF